MLIYFTCYIALYVTHNQKTDTITRSKIQDHISALQRQKTITHQCRSVKRSNVTLKLSCCPAKLIAGILLEMWHFLSFNISYQVMFDYYSEVKVLCLCIVFNIIRGNVKAKGFDSHLISHIGVS